MLFLRKSRKGFTLIELMVVVAIIGVLALLGLRMYATQQDKAKEAIVKANVGSVQVQIQTELVDNPDYTSGEAVTAANDPAIMNLSNPFTTGGIDDVAVDLLELSGEPAGPTPTSEGMVGIYTTTDASANTVIFHIIGYGKGGKIIPGYNLTARR